MNLNVKDKVIVITGSSRGIGRELAIHFAKEGASVVVNYNLHKEIAEKLYDEIKNYNSNCILIKADVTNKAEVLQFYKEVISKYSHVDVLINNAGICSDNRIQLMEYDQWIDVVNVNLTSVFLCSKCFSKKMIQQGYGKIINMASLKGQEGCVGQVNYSASKSGVIGLTKALAKELGEFNIAVNVLCPGFIVTDLNRHNEAKKKIAQTRSALNYAYSLDDLINFTHFLCSDSCRGVSGRVFNLDSRIL